MTVTSAAIATVRSDDRPVDRRLDQLLEVLEAVLVDDLAAEVVELPQRRDEQDRERAQVRDQQPADRPRQQQRQLQAGPAPEDIWLQRPAQRIRAASP